LIRPVVLLPDSSLAWPSERTEAVVLHELAHVRRWDSASQLVAVATCALSGFNPVVWL
jgi:beta-lactamase regulating signal transducer with metallopeptidase domain